MDFFSRIKFHLWNSWKYCAADTPTTYPPIKLVSQINWVAMTQQFYIFAGYSIEWKLEVDSSIILVIRSSLQLTLKIWAFTFLTYTRSHNQFKSGSCIKANKIIEAHGFFKNIISGRGGKIVFRGGEGGCPPQSPKKTPVTRNRL